MIKLTFLKELILIKQMHQMSVIFVTIDIFLDKGSKFQLYICNGCHDVLIMSINLTHPATRRRGEVITTSFCTCQRRRRYVPNETPNDVDKMSQWYVSMMSYWNVMTTSKEDVTTMSNQHVSTTS